MKAKLKIGTPKKAYRDPEFMESPDARPLRILAEYLEPLTRFEKNRVEDTIVFFGSARTKSKEEALKQIKKAKGQAAQAKAKIDLQMSRYYEDAVTLAKKMTEWSMALSKGKRRFIVCSGGGPGIMQAANRGAHAAGGDSIGLNISIPFEQVANPYITESLNFEFHYFFIRKYWFAYLAKALVIFPGGFGTMDELFEMLTLIQTDKIRKKIPIVIYGSGYWKKILNFEEMARQGTISPDDLDLLHFCDTPDQAYKVLTKELKKHYLGGKE